MADKGFELATLAAELEVAFVRPTELHKGALAAGEAKRSARVSRARSHVERLVQRFQRYTILSGRAIESREWEYIDDMVSV